MLNIVLARTVDSRYKKMMPLMMNYKSRGVDFVFYGEPLNGKDLNNVQQRITDTLIPINVSLNEYPPLRIQFSALMHLVRQERDWYMRCDPDTNINIERLQYALRRVSTPHPVAYGKFGIGRINERRFLGIDHYLQGGFCDTFNHAAAQRLRQNLPDCLNWSLTHIPYKYLHSDVEISRCMSRNNITLENWRPPFFTHANYGLSTKRRKYTLEPTKGEVCAPTTRALFSHPSKSAASYIIRQMMLNQDRRACAAAEMQAPVELPIQTFVIDGVFPEILPYFMNSTNVTGAYGESPTQFLTKGEHGYKSSMRRILEIALDKNLDYFATFDNDAAIRKNFVKNMEQVWPTVKCTIEGGGVVLLGTAAWNRKLINLLQSMSLGCFAYRKGVTGSFAVLWSKNAAKQAYMWNNMHESMPFDHVWEFLMYLNVSVQFLQPSQIVHNLNGLPSRTDPTRATRNFSVWGKHSDFTLASRWNNDASVSLSRRR